MMRGSLRIYLPTLFLFLIRTILGDPTNLVYNGDFEEQGFYFKQDIMFEIPANGLNDYIPMFKVAHGGVQILDTFEYHQQKMKNGQNGSFLCHMNYRRGPGVLHTIPIATPRMGATYTVKFLMADNPDGGPLYKTLRVRVLVNNRLSSPEIAPFSVSTPYSSRDSVMWSTKTFSFVGTGERTVLQFESLVLGAYGAFIDNITVALLTVIENGSFENITSALYARVLNVTGDSVLHRGNSDIPGWTVKSGKAKFTKSDWFYPSTDNSYFLLHMNAEFEAGVISSSPFSTTPGKMYKVLFDTAANPDTFPPLEGYITASAFSYSGGALLASRSIFLSGMDYTPSNVGWVTYVLEFKARKTETFVEFASQMKGSWNGPFLDNVAVFEVGKPGRYTSVPRTYSAGRPPLRPSLWTTSVTVALVMSIFGHLISEIWSLHS